MNKSWLVLPCLVFLGAAQPNPKLTPGKANPVLTRDVICSSSFRTGPYRNVPLSEKKRIAKAYGLDYEKTRKLVEYDHLISLELGGGNEDANIWPEFYAPVPGAHEKDLVENFLHRQVCSGNMELSEAQKLIVTDWLGVYQSIQRRKK